MPTPRPTDPMPDPLESQYLSSRPLFASTGDPLKFWLPDLSPAAYVEEYELLKGDEYPSGMKPAPPQPPYDDPNLDQLLIKYAADFSAWAFNTQLLLLMHRISVYNRYRRELNQTPMPPLELLGRYRRSCRLACEQILRRDLPRIPGFTWNYSHPSLPLFEMDYSFDVHADATSTHYETALAGKLKCVVETRVRRHKADTSPYFLATVTAGPLLKTGQPEWSSSSSSSSESEFDYS